jgi:Protein of unknown function (DUF1822)
MINASVYPTRLNLMQSETIWLEAEHLKQARTLTRPFVRETEQWQMYLNAIALLGFEHWLHKCAAALSIDRTQCLNEVGAIYRLTANGFKLNLIAKEHVLDEITEIPQAAIAQPERSAHYYVLLEVSEEQARVIIRGFLRYDRLIHHLNQTHQTDAQNDYYRIPLSVFDPDPNHLLFDCEFLDPAAIPLPALSVQHGVTAEVSLATVFQETRIKLGDLLQGIFAEGWQALNAVNHLINPDAQLALSPRNQKNAKKCGKLIDLGMQLQGHSAILLLNITEEAEENLSVLVQLHPASQEPYLPPAMTLKLLSGTGEKLQEVRARSQDNYIQLRSFKGKSGIPFQIMVSLGDICLSENFEL